MENKKRNRESTYPRTCKCGQYLKSRMTKLRHKCVIDPDIKPEDIIFERLVNSNYTESFKKLKCDIHHDNEINDYIENYKEDGIVIVDDNGIVEDKKLITLQSLFADIPEILADGAYIKVDIHTNLLYYVPCNKRTESIFQVMLKRDDMEITNIAKVL